jgi:tRNA pseudouridine55 synthase
MDGAIVVDKPEGWTSHDVVGKSRRILGTKKIGHLGTLDPIATGVLPLVIGRATRLAQFYTSSDKIYEAVIRFGFSTDTYDRAGTPTSPETEPAIDAADLETRMAQFRGDLMQVPPPVSAKKVAGVRAYKLARQNVAFELRASPVDIGTVTHIRQGRNFPASPFRTDAGSRYVKAVSREGDLVAIGEACLPNIYHPVVVL